MPYKDKEKERQAKRKYDQKRKGKRHKVWTGVFYEESCPSWRDRLSELTLPCCVSPLHDRDLWTKADEEENPSHRAGDLKRPHRHWLAEYPSAVDYETVMEDFGFLNSATVQYVRSLPAMALYLIHDGQRDKTRYSPEKVLEFGGASWIEWCAQAQDTSAQMKEMRRFIREHNVTEPADFQDFCDSRNEVWSRLLDSKCQNAIFRYIDRNRNRVMAQINGKSLQALSTTPPLGGSEPPNPEPSEEQDKTTGDEDMKS